MTTEKVIADIRWLYSKLAVRDSKYLRNLNRFLSNGARREGIRSIYTVPPAFINTQQDTTTGILPAINVGRSMAMALQSKLIQTKGRVFFNPVNGLWKTIKTCRSAQIFFDSIYEKESIYEKVQQSVLDSLIFEYGVIWINDEDKCVEHVLPWQFYIDPAEYQYDKMSRCMLMQEDFPLNDLRDKLSEEKTPMTFQALQANEFAKATVYRYWDLKGKKKYLVVNSEIIDEMDTDSDKMPFALFFYNKPVKGLFSVSLLDNVYTHQRQIDDIVRRIHDAFTLSPANTIYVPNDAQGNETAIAKMMSNKVGNIVPFNAALGQVMVVTPPAIDSQYFTALGFFQTSAFEQEGISQLSAQSRKPAGADSGRALDTLQDVESERFQTQVDQLIQFYKDINNSMIDTFPANDDILPVRLGRSSIKWSEIKKQREAFSMQSSLASALSKDPSVKSEQIDRMMKAGVLNPNMYAALMEDPDLEGAYSASTASFDNCRKIIERALDEDRYDFYAVVNLKQLLDESVNTLLQLDAVDEDPRILANLVKLIGIVNEKMKTVNGIQNPALPPPIVPPQPIADTAYDGGQLKELAGIVESVKAGGISPEAAQAVILAMFPQMDPGSIAQMCGIGGPAPTGTPAPGATFPINPMTPGGISSSPPAPPAQPAPPTGLVGDLTSRI